MNAENFDLRSPALRLLAAAPHRLLFCIGATNILLAMGWWTSWLVGARWGLIDTAQMQLPAGWMHAMTMQYQVLPSFMFGFLLTVFPRWMNQPALSRWHYLPVGLGLFGGQALTLAAVLGALPLLKAGAVVTLLGWSIGTVILAGLVRRDAMRTWHAISCTAALVFGLFGLALYTLCLYRLDGLLMVASVKIGSILMLLPIFFTVCHRMIPFFASGVIKGYRPLRPMWALAMFWVGVFAHAGLELYQGYAWLWLADLPLTVLTATLLWMWWPRGESMPPLLRVLFAGFAWLPIAFSLYAAQSVEYALTGQFHLGRAPAHALFIGFFGSLLVAMVTRVTQGHSGRPLVLGKVAAFAFITLQVVAVIRVLAEVLPDALAWQALAAAGWMLAFVPWVARSVWIYITPRIDGQPG